MGTKTRGASREEVAFVYERFVTGLPIVAFAAAVGFDVNIDVKQASIHSTGRGDPAHVSKLNRRGTFRRLAEFDRLWSMPVLRAACCCRNRSSCPLRGCGRRRCQPTRL